MLDKGAAKAHDTAPAMAPVAPPPPAAPAVARPSSPPVLRPVAVLQSEKLELQTAGSRLVYEEDEPAVSHMVHRLVEGTERHATLLHRNYRKDGSVIWVEWHNSALRDEAGWATSFVARLPVQARPAVFDLAPAISRVGTA